MASLHLGQTWVRDGSRNLKFDWLLDVLPQPGSSNQDLTISLNLAQEKQRTVSASAPPIQLASHISDLSPHPFSAILWARHTLPDYVHISGTAEIDCPHTVQPGTWSWVFSSVAAKHLPARARILGQSQHPEQINQKRTGNPFVGQLSRSQNIGIVRPPSPPDINST